MYPNVHIGALAVSSFSLAMAVAFAVAAWLGVRQARFVGVDESIPIRLVPWAAVAGVLGAKLYPILFNLPPILRGEQSVFNQGQVWYGGFIAGLFATAWGFRQFRLPVHLMLDYGATVIAAGHAIGRIGCFLVGDDYGLPTNSFVGVAFPNGNPPSTARNLRSLGVYVPSEFSDSAVLSVHPTQLYESAALALIAIWLWRASRKPHRRWSVFAQYLLLYGVWRFIVEVFRAKEDRIASGPLAGITIAQLISTALVAGGAALWFRFRNEPAEAAPPSLPSTAAK